MKVLVTGGTGFVGSHAVAALQRAGHDVRLLVRRPERVARTFGGLGEPAPGDVVAGDVLDTEVVRRALADREAVVHAAAVYSVDARRAQETLDTNAPAAENVLGAAVAAGCDPVVHVSSTVALVRFDGSGPDLPLGDLTLAYARSKIDSERVARRLQDDGAPVVCVYPGGVQGPHDPYLGDQDERLAWVVRGWLPLWPAGRLHVVDVRDAAAVLAAVVEPGRGPRRLVVPGHPVSASDLYGTVAATIGRRRPHVRLPVGAARAMGRATEPMLRHLPAKLRFPADREGIEITVRDTRFDTSAAEAELGVTARPYSETVRDTVAWLVDAGHLPEKYRPREGAPG